MPFYTPLSNFFILILLTPPVFWVDKVGKVFFYRRERRVCAEKRRGNKKAPHKCGAFLTLLLNILTPF